MWMSPPSDGRLIAQYHLGTSRCRREGASTPSESAGAKLGGAQVEQFETWGYPAWFQYLIGAGEVAAGVAFLVKRTRFLAAAAVIPIYVFDCHLPFDVLERTEPETADYIRRRESEGITTGYLASRRDPWYSLEGREPAPFLCTYMGRSANGSLRSGSSRTSPAPSPPTSTSCCIRSRRCGSGWLPHRGGGPVGHPEPDPRRGVEDESPGLRRRPVQGRAARAGGRWRQARPLFPVATLIVACGSGTAVHRSANPMVSRRSTAIPYVIRAETSRYSQIDLLCHPS